MYFCPNCLTKHESNALFSSHHVVNMDEKHASEVLFCKQHQEHPVRYFCKSCSLMLCTICTMEHNPQHKTEPLEKGIIEKYRKDLLESLRAIKSRLSEVNSRAKYLETIKDAQQKCMFETQKAIKDRTDVIVAQIREKESELLAEVTKKVEQRMRETGIESLTEMKFHGNEMQSLCSEIQTVVQGSPQQCLVAYDDLIARLKSLPEAPSVVAHRPTNTKTNMFRFIPGESEKIDASRLIGTLKECSLADSSTAGASTPMDATDASSPTTHRRTTSILSVLSSGRKADTKRNRMKSSSTSSASTSTPKAAGGKINADDLLRRSAATSVKPKITKTTPTSSSHSDVTPVSSTTSRNKYKLVFKVDQVGGWPGKVTSPSSVTSSERLIVVAECENRLQLFDTSGLSMRVIGWGKTKPQRVTSLADGRIAITDRIDNCVKVFTSDGELVSSWGAGMFSSPTGIAVMSNGNYVITDVERCLVSVHTSDNGWLVTSFGSWGSGDAQLQNPGYVTVDSSDNILVSDSGNRCIKMFDSSGNFLRSLPSSSSKSAQLRHPMGVVVTRIGSIVVADRDSHRLVMMTSDGVIQQEVLTKSDGVKFPVDVALVGDDQIAVVEAHNGFLSKDQHHAVKLYKLIDS